MSNLYLQHESYKDSGIGWLGVIPSHWQLLKNKFLFYEKKETVGQYASMHTLLSLTLHGIIARDMENPQGKFPAEFNTYKIVAPDDLVFCLFDIEETPRTVGIAHQEGMITGAYTVFKCNSDVNPHYLYYYYLSLDFDKRLQTLYTGLRKVIQRGTFMGIHSPVPPRTDQDRIVAFLDEKTQEIDQAIAQKRRLIDLLQEQKAILINTAVTQGFNPHAPTKDSGIDWLGPIPAHWEVKKLKFFCSVQSGFTLGTTYSGKRVKSYPYLRVANVQYGYFKLDDIAEIRLPDDLASQYYVRKGDILVTEGGDIDKLGRGTVWESQIDNCLHQNHIFAIRVDNKVASEYFVSLVMSANYGRKYFTETANKTTNLASTNKRKLVEFPVVLPPIEEQNTIVHYARQVNDSFDYLLRKVDDEIASLKTLTTVLISEAVTGKIKV